MSMELLAPAGSYDVFKIAVNLGADAVYLSGKRFGARAYAENFNMEKIKKSVTYAHLNNVKVFVTVNTLINNYEVIDFVKYIFKLYKIGVDAVIVQDYGILKLIRSLFPHLKIHASTQMSLNNYYSALWASKNGISRIIFPRELSIDDISNIHEKLKNDNIDLELEVFSHGALCYSVSGNCYISSLNNGRSGNRGACTQPCRREYTLKYQGHKVDKGFLLSTHDLNVSDDLDKLANAGIDSIKLEGRMKSEDYVGTIVNSYRNLIDHNEGNYKENLNLVFNRKFTKGYLLNQKPGNVMGRESSGHVGFYIGDITNINKEFKENNEFNKNNNKHKESTSQNKNKKYRKNNKSSKNNENNKNYKNYENKGNNINNGNYVNNGNDMNNKNNHTDYDEEGEEGRTVKEILISKENPVMIEQGDGIAFKRANKIKGIYIDDIIEQNEEHLVLNTTRNVKVGDKVFISYSRAINKELKKYRNENIQSKIPISLDISLDENLHVHIRSKFELKGSKLEFDYLSLSNFEKAINRPISIEEIEKQLSKTGKTPFFMENIEINNFPSDLFMPISELNKIRRELLDKASEILLDFYRPSKKQVNKTKETLNNFIKNYKSNKTKSLKVLENQEIIDQSHDLTMKNTNKLGISGISVFVDNLNLVKIASSYPIEKIYFDPSYLYNSPTDYFKNIENILTEASINAHGIELVWVLPSLISDEEINKCVDVFYYLKDKGISLSIMTDIAGISDLFEANVYGNHNLNIWNSFACENLKESGFNSTILSSELSYSEIKELTKELSKNLTKKLSKELNKELSTELNSKYIEDMNLELIVHGNLEIMVSKDDFSQLSNGKNLNIADSSDYVILEDKKRKKFKYKVLFDFNRKSHFRNKDCLCLIDELKRIEDIGINSIVLDCRFSDENYSSQIISLYLDGMNNKNKNKLHSLKEEIYSISHSYLSKGNFLDGRLHEKED